MTVAKDWQPVVVDDAVSPFRRRLLDGLAASIDERGYRDTTVADIVRHARTSKRTFYGEFSSKEECFIELLTWGNQQMIANIRAAVDPEADWREQVRKAVDAWVAEIEARPAITLSWIRELPALGRDVRALQRRGMNAFVDMFVEFSSNAGFQRAGIAPLSRQMAVLLFGGLRELSALTVEDGADVRELVETAVAGSIAILSAGRID
ncbi:TetR family transcriptional regulator [Mycolicibacterium agri]|uniref:TetR family transcriptional regulator n=1 Tax=Mycolicibacterium agri TaxID=36811 RepID=A0A2A7MR33_MYCAG|nr:TetR/AcrR family transcriptional regulator [Mycolicibacterium agri]PEG34144.1 TetR family transcriptional regulator [Mycolicibacterium agri]GFG53701.1 TetR family transcriptional regulator [Mycolicibacterium agri]